MRKYKSSSEKEKSRREAEDKPKKAVAKSKKVTDFFYAGLMMMISSFLSSCREKATEGSIYRTNPESLRSCLCFRVFPLKFFCFRPLWFVACWIPPSRDNCSETSYLRPQQRGLGGNCTINHQPYDYGRRKNDAPNHFGHKANRKATAYRDDVQ